MNKLFIIAFIALSVSAELRTLAADEPMVFKANDLKTFDFIQNEVDQTWGNAIYLGDDAIASNACSSYTGFQMRFPVVLPNNTETNGMGVEVCMMIPKDELAKNTPGGKTFLITNRFDAKQNWGTSGTPLEPTFTVDNMFDANNATSGRNMTYTWFTGMWTPTKNETTNMTTWCMQSENFGNFFGMARKDMENTFDFYVNVIMNDLEANRTDCETNETAITSVEFCGLTKPLDGCAAGAMPPTLTLSMGSTSSSGTNWLLWGGVGVGVVVVVGVVAFMMKGKGDDTDYGQAE